MENQGKSVMKKVVMVLVSIWSEMRTMLTGVVAKPETHSKGVLRQAESPRREKSSARAYKTNKRYAKQRSERPKKPDYKVVPTGTTWLIDGANLLGSIGPEYARTVFSTIVKTMNDRGYKTMIFLERRSLRWAYRRQVSKEAITQLAQYVKSGHVTLVDNEADLSILQVARITPGSVIVSHDHFNDYRKAFGDVLDTHRITGFSSVKVDDSLILSFFGLKDAIKIPLSSQETSVKEEPAVVEKKPAAKPVMRQKEEKSSLLVSGERNARKGDVQKAMSCFTELARRKDIAGYRALAGLYEDTDSRKSRKYEVLAERLEKRMKEDSKRKMRVYNENRRHGKRSGAHFSERCFLSEHLSAISRTVEERCRMKRVA